MKAADIMLKIQVGYPPEKLTLDEMNCLYRRYGKNWWKDKRMNFSSNPLYFDREKFTPRKRPW